MIDYEKIANQIEANFDQFPTTEITYVNACPFDRHILIQ